MYPFPVSIGTGGNLCRTSGGGARGRALRFSEFNVGLALEPQQTAYVKVTARVESNLLRLDIPTPMMMVWVLGRLGDRGHLACPSYAQPSSYCS